MRKYLLAAGLLSLLLCGVYCAADDEAPKVEIFGGYSFLHIDAGTTPIKNQIPEGFNVDGTYYFYKFLGGTADFQYHRKEYGGSTPQADCPATIVICGTATVVNFHAGPRFKARTGKIEPFAHALFGFTHGTFDFNQAPSVSSNAFSTKLGAGVDIVVTAHWAFRLAEANIYLTKFNETDKFNFNPGSAGPQNNFTLSTGIVYRH